MPLEVLLLSKQNFPCNHKSGERKQEASGACHVPSWWAFLSAALISRGRHDRDEQLGDTGTVKLAPETLVLSRERTTAYLPFRQRRPARPPAVRRVLTCPGWICTSDGPVRPKTCYPRASSDRSLRHHRASRPDLSTGDSPPIRFRRILYRTQTRSPPQVRLFSFPRLPHIPRTRPVYVRCISGRFAL